MRLPIIFHRGKEVREIIYFESGQFNRHWLYLVWHFDIAGRGDNLFVKRFPHTPSKNFFSACCASYGFLFQGLQKFQQVGHLFCGKIAQLKFWHQRFSRRGQHFHINRRYANHLPLRVFQRHLGIRLFHQQTT